MSRTGTLILLGILVTLMPFSGLPIALRSSLLVVFGLSVLGIGLSLRKSDVHAAVASAPAPLAEMPVESRAEPAPELSIG